MFRLINSNQRNKNANELQRQLRNVTKTIQRTGNEAQEPARQHQLVNSGAARAGRPDATSHRRRGERRAGYTNQLARSAKLRDLHAADSVPDGREASSGGWRNGRYHSDQGTKVHGVTKKTSAQKTWALASYWAHPPLYVRVPVAVVK